jgi:hypothetical protein
MKEKRGRWELWLNGGTGSRGSSRCCTGGDSNDRAVGEFQRASGAKASEAAETTRHER